MGSKGASLLVEDHCSSLSTTPCVCANVPFASGGEWVLVF